MQHSEQPRVIPQSAGRRVLIVANRLPVAATVSDDQVRLEPADGSLASGMRQIARHWSVVWFGWLGLEAEFATRPAVHTLAIDDAGTLVRVTLDEAEISHFFRRYCNSTLWPVLHGWTDEPPPLPEDWEMYTAVNRRFADAVLRVWQPGDRVWVHDFHLLLLPGMLREQVPDMPIAFFLHAPFPDPGIFAHVPHCEQLIAGALGANVLGFHGDLYATNFLRAAAAHNFIVTGSNIRVGDRRACVRSRPMGIDVASFSRLATDPDVLSDAERMRASHAALLLGVDRLDYTRALPQRLLAFEFLLQEHAELRGRVSLLQIATPSRAEPTAGLDLEDVIENLVRRINRTFGQPGWTPVQYLHGTVDVNTLASLYRAADVMICTSRRTGLNLVAREFLATRTDEDGVLIINKFNDSAEELAGALHVDPNRVTELAAAYHAALTMPAQERLTRMRQLRNAFLSNTLLQWAADFLDRLPGPSDFDRPGAIRSEGAFSATI